jgi:hypothetical protein
LTLFQKPERVPCLVNNLSWRQAVRKSLAVAMPIPSCFHFSFSLPVLNLVGKRADRSFSAEQGVGVASVGRGESQGQSQPSEATEARVSICFCCCVMLHHSLLLGFSVRKSWPPLGEHGASLMRKAFTSLERWSSPVLPRTDRSSLHSPGPPGPQIYDSQPQCPTLLAQNRPICGLPVTSGSFSQSASKWSCAKSRAGLR